MSDHQYVDNELMRYIEYLQTQIVTPGWEKIHDLEAYKAHVRRGPAIASMCTPELWQQYHTLICEFQPRTAFDSPSTKAVFEPILRAILEAARDLGIAPTLPIYLSSSTDVSATALSVPSTDSHLLFAGLGTMSFCNYWAKAFSKIVAYFVQDHGPVSMASELLRITFARHPEAIILPIKLCAYHSRFKTLVGFGEVSVQPGNEAYRLLLLKAMELFVIGHEIGHFYLEEMLPENSNEKSGPKAELVCDQYALQVSRASASNSSNWVAFTGAGAYLFFRAAAFCFPRFEVDQSAGESDTHPRMKTRIAELRQQILSTTPSDQRPPLESYVTDFGMVCDEIEHAAATMSKLFCTS